MFVPGWNRFQDAARAFEIRGEGEIAIVQILSLGNLLPIAGSGPKLDLWGDRLHSRSLLRLTSTELCRWLGIVAPLGKLASIVVYIENILHWLD